MRKIGAFVSSKTAKQHIRMTDRLPTPHQYLSLRKSTSAAGVCLAMTDFALRMELPPDVLYREEMTSLLEQANIIVQTVNDILSLRKEIVS